MFDYIKDTLELMFCGFGVMVIGAFAIALAPLIALILQFAND